MNSWWESQGPHPAPTNPELMEKLKAAHEACSSGGEEESDFVYILDPAHVKVEKLSPAEFVTKDGSFTRTPFHVPDNKDRMVCYILMKAPVTGRVGFVQFEGGTG